MFGTNCYVLKCSVVFICYSCSTVYAQEQKSDQLSTVQLLGYNIKNKLEKVAAKQFRYDADTTLELLQNKTATLETSLPASFGILQGEWPPRGFDVFGCSCMLMFAHVCRCARRCMCDGEGGPVSV